MRYRRHPNTAARVVSGQAFIITGVDNKLHGLNETATLVWEMAADGFSPADVADSMAAKFEVDASSALADVEACVADFVQRGILVSEE